METTPSAAIQQVFCSSSAYQKGGIGERRASMRAGLLPKITFVWLCCAITLPAQLLPPFESDADGAVYARGEVIVQFTPAATQAQVNEAIRAAELNVIEHIQTPAMKALGQIGVTHANTRLPVPAAIRALKNLPGVAFVEPNYFYTSQFDANDPLYLNGSLWGAYGDDVNAVIGPAPTTNPFGSQAENAWAAGMIGSQDVLVAVIDQGLQFDHPDLSANIWTNPGELPGNGLDDDANGYVDDIHGWNAIADDGGIYDPQFDRHGTHVAGTVGAVGGNGLGAAGINWNVTLVSGKFLGTNGSGSTVDAIQAIDYMTALRTRKGLNIVALNASWGGGGFSQGLLDSITRAAQAGILFVAAAGNRSTNTDVSPFYPACYDTSAAAGYDSVVSVASIDSSGLKAATSSYGQQTVDLGGPGVAIYSTLPGDTYGPMSGTSMATPHVAGAVALFASTHPAASPLQIRDELLTFGVRPTESLSGLTATGGRLDVTALMSVPGEAVLRPVAPVSVQAIAVSAGRVDVSWTDQSGDELGFAIERSTDGQSFFLVDTVSANLSTYSDGTARPATSYLYRVRAYNRGGSSGPVYANAAVLTPDVALPAAPASLAASATRGSVNLTWSDRSNNEDGFQIERKIGTGAWRLLVNTAANTTKFADAATVPRTKYSYRVRAFNAAGRSAYSNQVTVTAK